jgi:aminopeptidase N
VVLNKYLKAAALSFPGFVGYLRKMMLRRFCILAAFVFFATAVFGQSAVFQAHLLKYDVKYYWISLDVSNTSAFIKGHSTIGAEVTAASLDTFAFQLHANYTIDSVVVNGKKYTALKRTNGEARLKLSSAAAKGTMVHATVYYSGTAPKEVNTWSVGLVNTKDKFGRGITYTMSVPYSANSWFPCKQVMPDLADSVFLDITTDSSLKVAGNGLLVNVKDLGNGSKTWSWRTHYPINYYLIAFSAGRYAEIKGEVTLPGQSTPMLLHSMVYDDSATISAGKELLTKTAGEMLINYSNLFGTYPFAKEKFGIYTIPLSGGMEHQTMPALGEIEFYLLAHEMAHQWFGDHVNLGTFRDMWLNEGWASYCEYLTAEKFQPTQAVTIMGNYHYDVLQSAKGVSYVHDTIIFDSLYNGRLVYHKGAAVFNTLRHVIDNDTIFFGAVATYQKTYGFRTATMPDFIRMMENISGKDLKQFFQQWYYGAGYPTFAATWYQKNGIVKLKLVQTTSAPAITPLFITPLEIALKTANGRQIVRLDQSISTQYYEIPFVPEVTGITIDPDNWLLNKLKTITKDSSILSLPVDGNKGEGMRVYPNPFSKSICVDLPYYSPDTYVKLTTMTGTTVSDTYPQKSSFSLDTTGLAKGLYILAVRQHDVWQFTRLLKVE